MKILPRLKDYEKSLDKFYFPKDVDTKIVLNDEDGCYVDAFTTVFNDYFKQLTHCSLSTKNGKELIFTKKIQSEKQEYYEISILEEKIEIRYSDKLALRNAIATIISLTIQDKDKLYVDCAEIKDYPNFHYRSMLIDLARRYVPIEELKMHIRTLGLCKYNYLHWHLSDTSCFGYEVKCLPELNYKVNRKILSLEEMKELIDYAQSFGVESVPEIDVPAHCQYFTSVYPELLCEVEEPRDFDRPISTYTMCLSNQKTYDVVEKLIDELCGIFKGEYFHMGGDELYFYDIDFVNFWPEWKYCKHCKELAKRENIKDDLDFYIYFANKINKVIKRYGKKMIVYNDAIDISKPTKLDKDIIIHFWRVAMEDRGPVEGCSMQGFLDQGFKVINSYFPETYMCDFVKEDLLCKWNPLSSPKVLNEKESQIMGGEVCAWGIHNHFDYSMLPILCYFSDRLWNYEQMEESEEINQAFVRQTISHEKSTADIFSILNSRIPPLNDYDKFYYDRVDKDLDKIEVAIKNLTRLYNNGIGEIRAIRGYIYVLQELRNVLRKEQNLPMVDTTLWGFISESKLRKEGRMK